MKKSIWRRRAHLMVMTTNWCKTLPLPAAGTLEVKLRIFPSLEMPISLWMSTWLTMIRTLAMNLPHPSTLVGSMIVCSTKSCKLLTVCRDSAARVSLLRRAKKNLRTLLAQDCQTPTVISSQLHQHKLETTGASSTLWWQTGFTITRSRKKWAKD